MTILVTGGAGFLGSHLLERLVSETDARLVCLDNFNDYYSPEQKRQNLAVVGDSERFELHEADLCDLDALEALFAQHDIRHVFHLAACAGVRPSLENPLLYERVNVQGTLGLLEVIRRHQVEKFVFTSSATVYGVGCAVPFQEDAPLGQPASPYGVTKRAAELLCFLYHQLHGLPVVVVRPFSVIGPRLRPDLALSIFAAAIDDGRPLPLLGDGSAQRDFTYIDDFIDGLVAAWRCEAAVGQAINLGHHQPEEIRKVIELLSAALGKGAQIEYRPEHPGDLPITCADVSKAGSLFGYRPKVDLEEGIAKFVEWFRSGGRVAQA